LAISAKLFCIAEAAIQISFSGMGFPSFFN